MDTVHVGYAVGSGEAVEIPLRNLVVTGQTQDAAAGHWLAGLVDGEGCFFLSTSRTRRARGYDREYRCLTFEFKLALRADDLARVRYARELLGVGAVHVYRRARPATSPNGRPLATLTVYARSDIPRVVAFFRQFQLRSKKARDFTLWADAFDRYQAALAAAPLSTVSLGRINRVAAGKRRPVVGTTRSRFRVIPDALWHDMTLYATAIATGREYVGPDQ